MPQRFSFEGVALTRVNIDTFTLSWDAVTIFQGCRNLQYSVSHYRKIYLPQNCQKPFPEPQGYKVYPEAGRSGVAGSPVGTESTTEKYNSHTVEIGLAHLNLAERIWTRLKNAKSAENGRLFPISIKFQWAHLCMATGYFRYVFSWKHLGIRKKSPAESKLIGFFALRTISNLTQKR